MVKGICVYNMNLSNILKKADKKEISQIIKYYCEDASHQDRSSLANLARSLRNMHYGRTVFFRGLIEFSNYCKNNCYYCGIRRGNKNITRYRLTEEEILECCNKGYKLGFRTFVLQGGEDKYFTDDKLYSIIYGIKSRFSDCAVTLSAGERSFISYKKLYDAGADRYLLRHETADNMHYNKLHPCELSLEDRKQCLYNLKKIGYQVGAGFMVDSPYQNYDTISEDFLFLRELKPHMIGIGPFIPHKDTKFKDYYTPTSDKTVIILSLIRIMLPKVLLPATTALASVDKSGYQKGLLAGANVIMPNLSPKSYRKNYLLYDNKIQAGLETAEHFKNLVKQVEDLGMIADFSRGDHADIKFKDVKRQDNI